MILSFFEGLLLVGICLYPGVAGVHFIFKHDDWHNNAFGALGVVFSVLLGIALWKAV